MDPVVRYRSALITGATSGFGRAVALELARSGSFIHALGRRSELLASLMEELPAGGAAYAVDVTNSAELEAAVHEADAHAASPGGLDLVIANAGIAENGIASKSDADAARKVLAVNSIAAIETLEYAKTLMLARGSGHLVAISSLAGTRGLPGAPAYCASKAALSTFVASLRFRLRHTGVSITDIQPGFIKTAMTDRNRFKMPFLMELDAAAKRTVKALEKERPPRTLRFPRRLAWPLRAAALALPAWAWERLGSPTGQPKQ